MLSIIIVNYKTSRDLTRCLESIVQYEKNYRKYEFIIVDNNSDDHGLETVKQTFKFIRIIHAPMNGGFAYGNNIGINNSKGEYIFLLNPDTYIADNGIEKLLNRMVEDRNIDIIGPKLLNPDGSNQSYFLPKSYLTLWKIFCEQLYLHKIFKNIKLFNSYFRTYMHYDKENFVEQVSGAAFMFRRDIIATIGLLDENYFMYFEESDYCLQAVKHGLKLLYYPDSRITHTQAAGTFSERSIRDFVKSFKYFFKKNFSLLVYYPVICIFIIGSLLRLTKSLVVLDKNHRVYLYYLKCIVKG